MLSVTVNDKEMVAAFERAIEVVSSPTQLRNLTAPLAQGIRGLLRRNIDEEGALSAAAGRKKWPQLTKERAQERFSMLVGGHRIGSEKKGKRKRVSWEKGTGRGIEKAMRNIRKARGLSYHPMLVWTGQLRRSFALSWRGSYWVIGSPLPKAAGLNKKRSLVWRPTSEQGAPYVEQSMQRIHEFVEKRGGSFSGIEDV